MSPGRVDAPCAPSGGLRNVPTVHGSPSSIAPNRTGSKGTGRTASARGLAGQSGGVAAAPPALTRVGGWQRARPGRAWMSNVATLQRAWP